MICYDAFAAYALQRPASCSGCNRASSQAESLSLGHHRGNRMELTSAIGGS